MYALLGGCYNGFSSQWLLQAVHRPDYHSSALVVSRNITIATLIIIAAAGAAVGIHIQDRISLKSHGQRASQVLFLLRECCIVGSCIPQ
jgi:hypothetical protein